MEMQFALNAAAFIHLRPWSAISEMSQEACLDDGECSRDPTCLCMCVEPSSGWILTYFFVGAGVCEPGQESLSESQQK